MTASPRKSSDEARVIAGFVILLCALTGCVSLPQSAALRGDGGAGLPPRMQLDQVPFYAQEEYQCGPAALAMALGAAGVDARPEALAEQVYIPAREGSLQVEMLAGARRHGLLAYVLAPELTDVLAEVAAGNAVIVLQNLGLFAFHPYWHYAVVIGYDLEQNQILLHSGTKAHRAMPFSLFEFLWIDSKRWAMVALPPSRLPASAREAQYASAAAALEQTGRIGEAHLAYAALHERWPANLVGLMGLGNTAYALGHKAEAETAFRSATALHPRSAAAFNNLAQTLADQGKFDAALDAARKAVSLGGTSLPTAQATLEQIQAGARK
ncbi:MAG: PA2778 family cysteine peptidase [Burkholderiales bacterium]|nr:PA2778 family cysteine peptidase [Burkholderiales bacterium]